jgi:hypothetical protein
VKTRVAVLSFDIPTAAAMKSSGWGGGAENLGNAVMAPIATRLAELTQAGLAGPMVVWEFLE